jgi:excisionase family DNA binding protein
MARPLLYATVPPMTALLLLQRFGDAIREQADQYVGAGRPELARELRFVVGQFEASAAQLSMEAVAAVVISDCGSDEAEVGSELESLDLSTTQAAERLGLTRERVVQLLKAADLVGRKVGGVWLVNAQSVDDLIEARRAA